MTSQPPAIAARPSPAPEGSPSALGREIVVALRIAGPASPDQLADRIGASRTGVLQQLHGLESAGLVERTLVRHGIGRPRHVYELTRAAQTLFPAAYAGLAEGLLAAVRAVGGESLVEEVFAARRRQLESRLRSWLAERLPEGGRLWDRVREVASFQDGLGYLASASRDPDGTIHLHEHNCAIFSVSGTYPQACAAELQLLGDLLGARVSRECHIVSGERSCSYRIEPPPQDGEPAAGERGRLPGPDDGPREPRPPQPSS